jgi:hypothetical protein
MVRKVRGRGRKPRPRQEGLPPSGAPDGVGADTAGQSREDRRFDLLEALGSMRRQARAEPDGRQKRKQKLVLKVIYLRLLEFEPTEVAEVLGLSRDQEKDLWALARVKLGRRLQGYGPGG